MNVFSINDNTDILVEILSHLDGRSLGVASCVCKLWCTVCHRDAVWEALCNRHVSGGGPGTRAVVAALGGYQRLYRVCIGPALDRLGRFGWNDGEDPSRLSLSLSLSLSLFSIDCYERLGVGGRGRGRGASLLFLTSPVDVS